MRHLWPRLSLASAAPSRSRIQPSPRPEPAAPTAEIRGRRSEGWRTTRDRLTRLGVIIAVLLAAAGARAQSPPDALIGGQVEAAFANNGGIFCYVGQGASTFQRNGTNATAVISFPELVYFDGTYHPLSGQARLTFSSATDGTIKFKFYGTGGPITDPSFSAYSETFNGQQFIVSFTIAFPNSCSLPIFAGYETP